MLVSRETYNPNSRPAKRVEFGEEEERNEGAFDEKRKLNGGSERDEVSSDEGQANKSARGMPWHQEPTKDVISCEKPRGAANKLRSGDVRMGKPT